MSDTVTVKAIEAKLMARGIEVLPSAPARTIPAAASLEPPCSIKWLQIEHSFSLGAFSYAVSGHAFAVHIGRYCSIGEGVQFGRQDHPTSWVSTSPSFYLSHPLFGLPESYKYSKGLDLLPIIKRNRPSTQLQVTHIEHDVWIGHAAFIRAGVRIGTGAVVAAHAVVVKDVPPYAVVAGNPATIKKFRLPPHLIGPLLGLQWWRYAAWDIVDLPMEDPKEFIPAFRELKPKLTPYEPDKVTPGELA